MIIKLEEQVVRAETVQTVVRKALYATQCDACKTVFQTVTAYDRRFAEICGIFDKSSPGNGNMFRAHVCSFACAHVIFAEGGWRNIPEYKPFAEIDANLSRASVELMAQVQDENTLRRNWSSTPIGLAVKAFGV